MNSTTTRPRFSLAGSIVFCAAWLALHGCSSGSGGSDVDSSVRSPPVARPLVMNSGASNTVREGAEVLLTGRDSDDADGPLLEWTWSAPPGVELTTRNRTTVSFTAPAVDVATTYPITLTVLDADGETGTSAVDVRVVPARDPNLFLAPRAGQVATPDVATLTVALAPGTAVGPLDAPFTVTLSATVSYVSRGNVQERVDLDVDWLAAPLTGHWPAGETVACSPGQRAEPCMLGSWINSRYQFQVPRLDVAELNQRFIASGELGRQLDPHRADSAVVEVQATLDAAGLQDKAYLLLSHDGLVIAQAPPALIGVPAALSVTTDALLAGLGGEEQRATAEAYYRTVDPRGRRQTLSDWLFAAGFADSGGTLLPEAVAGTGDFAHAKYTNNFDLGFGRDMYSRVEPNGNVYSFVVNYRTLEATIKNTDSFVTVAMEFTPPDDPSLHASCLTRGRYVKFFTYVPDGTGDSTRVTSIDFDGRGERPTPGNCVTCHGGTLGTLSRLVANPADPSQTLYRDCGDTDATFLPWDLDSFLYSDTDPAILAGSPRRNGTSFAAYTDPDGHFRREPQEEQFRKLNAAALATYETYVAEGGDAARIAAVTDLIHGWYGAQPKAPGARFGGAYTPPGWDVSPAVANVYHTAFARYCRSCHLQLTDTSKQLATYADLVVNPLTGAPRTLEDLIYRRGVMPFARLTADRFWVPFQGNTTAAQLLAAQLATDLGSDPTLRPGAPVFNVTRTPNPTKHGDVVRLSARNSTFVPAPRWSALATTAGGACVEPATLVGASTLEVTFRTGGPGRYCIELTSGAASVVEQFDVVPNQPPLLVPKSRLRIDANAGATSVDLGYGDADDPPTAVVFALTRVAERRLDRGRRRGGRRREVHSAAARRGRRTLRAALPRCSGSGRACSRRLRLRRDRRRRHARRCARARVPR